MPFKIWKLLCLGRCATNDRANQAAFKMDCIGRYKEGRLDINFFKFLCLANLFVLHQLKKTTTTTTYVAIKATFHFGIKKYDINGFPNVFFACVINT